MCAWVLIKDWKREGVGLVCSQYNNPLASYLAILMLLSTSDWYHGSAAREVVWGCFPGTTKLVYSLQDAPAIKSLLCVEQEIFWEYLNTWVPVSIDIPYASMMLCSNISTTAVMVEVAARNDSRRSDLQAVRCNNGHDWTCHTLWSEVLEQYEWSIA